MSAPELPGATIVCAGAPRNEWLGLRRIGGSTIAAICEIEGAWGSRRAAYLDLIGEGIPFEGSIYTESGEWYEQRAMERFSHLSGIETFQPDPITMYAKKDLPFATASPDGLAKDLSAWIEIKWVGSHRTTEWTGTPPEHYEAQVQWGLAVSGLPIGYLFAEIGGQNPIWYEIEADLKRQAEMLERAAEFWALVESRTPPEVDGSETTKRAINAQFSEPVHESMEGGPELALAVAELIDAQAAASVATKAQTLAENKVKLILREYELGTVEGQTVVSWKEQGRRGLDLDAIRVHLGPDVSKFEQTSSFRVLRISNGAK